MHKIGKQCEAHRILVRLFGTNLATGAMSVELMQSDLIRERTSWVIKAPLSNKEQLNVKH